MQFMYLISLGSATENSLHSFEDGMFTQFFKILVPCIAFFTCPDFMD